jgi:hypothetical protein
MVKCQWAFLGLKLQGPLGLLSNIQSEGEELELLIQSVGENQLDSSSLLPLVSWSSTK